MVTVTRIDSCLKIFRLALEISWVWLVNRWGKDVKSGEREELLLFQCGISLALAIDFFGPREFCVCFFTLWLSNY